VLLLVMVGHRSLTMMRGFTSTTTTPSSGPTSHPGTSGRFEVLSVPSWKRGHGSQGSVGERIQVIPGFKTSAGKSNPQYSISLSTLLTNGSKQLSLVPSARTCV
jgi:hypothetical protein